MQSRKEMGHPTCAQERELRRYWRWEDADCDGRLVGVVGAGLTDSAGWMLQNPGLEKLDHAD